MRSFKGLAACGVVAGSLGLALGCANNYTCVDYKTCIVDGAVVDGSIDVVRGDAMGDGSATTHDGGAHDGSTDAGADGHGSDSGTGDGGKGDGGMDSGCNLTLGPSQEACIVSDTNGVFVAPASNGGSAGGTGTQTSPYLTIT